jgi:hypothetical protein
MVPDYIIFGVSMKRLQPAVLAAAAIMCLSAATVHAGPVLLEGDALRDAVTDRTVYVETPVGPLPIQYAANGTMSASGPEEMVSLAGESVRNDRGKWWINGSQLCQRWHHWLERQSYCYQMRKRGNTVHWTRNDGQSGTARLSPKVLNAAAAE